MCQFYSIFQKILLPCVSNFWVSTIALVLLKYRLGTLRPLFSLVLDSYNHLRSGFSQNGTSLPVIGLILIEMCVKTGKTRTMILVSTRNRGKKLMTIEKVYLNSERFSRPENRFRRCAKDQRFFRPRTKWVWGRKRTRHDVNLSTEIVSE